MPYEITITKIETTKKIVKPSWQQIDKDGNYGYPPNEEVEGELKTEIYRQQIDELDLNEVIKAVNSL